jgi:hypothetical protein
MLFAYIQHSRFCNYAINKLANIATVIYLFI